MRELKWLLLMFKVDCNVGMCFGRTMVIVSLEL